MVSVTTSDADPSTIKAADCLSNRSNHGGQARI
jgi:hypothetical protein